MIMDEYQDLVYCLKEQISEISLVQSMYAEPHELEFSDDFDIAHLNRYVDGLDASPPSPNEFCIRISICSNDNPVEITFYLPMKYPKFQQLSAFVRCNSIENRKVNKLNANLREYLLESTLGEPKIFDCLTWIRENLTENDFLPAKIDEFQNNYKNASKKLSFERYWIYSHHIYSKIKRKHLLSLSSQLNLSGFSVPGKPGLICVEGLADDCQEFWDLVKMWSWKHIVLKDREKCEFHDEISSQAFRKFENFKEIPLDGIKNFLQEHNCDQAFSILFGFEDKSNG